MDDVSEESAEKDVMSTVKGNPELERLGTVTCVSVFFCVIHPVAASSRCRV